MKLEIPDERFFRTKLFHGVADVFVASFAYIKDEL